MIRPAAGPVRAPSSAAGPARAPSARRATATRGPGRDRRRAAGTLCAITLLVLVAMAARVLLGTPVVPAGQALAVLSGEQVPGISFIVMDSRLPAAVVAVLAGIAFGLSGTIFQTLLRNPLASPDVIGVTLGASAGTVVAMTVFGATGAALFWSALLGGLGTAVLILLVAGAGRAGAAGAVDNRFVLVGIGVGAALSSLISYLLTRISTRSAGDVMHWMIGSLSTSTWERARVLALALAVLVPVLMVLVTGLRILQLGDDMATGLGLSVRRTRIGLILVGVTLSALTVAVTGPLSFVAFLAGPLARMLLGRPSFPLAAAMGAAIVLLADVVGQNAVPGTALPAGVITGALGAPFLLWMLTRTPGSRDER